MNLTGSQHKKESGSRSGLWRHVRKRQIFPLLSVTYFAVIVRGFCARIKDSENMPDRCVVAGCSNTSNAEKEIALYKIPFFGDHRSEAKARRKKWTDFVKLKRSGQRLHPQLSAPVTLLQKTLPDGLVLAAQTTTNTHQRWDWYPSDTEIPTKYVRRRRVDSSDTRRQVSLHACCFGLVSLLFNCEMLANWNFITYFATGFPTYYELYFHLCSLLHLLL